MSLNKELEQTIRDLYQLESNTTHVCQDAKDLFKTKELKQTLRDYYFMHEDHLNELELILRKNNIPVPERTCNFQGKLHYTWTIVQSVFGEKSALKAMKKYEEKNIHTYTQALRKVVEKDLELNALLQKHLRQEKNYCHYLTRQIDKNS